MKGVKYAFLTCGLLIHAGCATVSLYPHTTTPSEKRVFRLTIDTDPTGAQMLRPLQQGHESVGVTPLRLSIPFEKRPVEGWTRILGQREWHPAVGANHAQLVRRTGEHFVIRIPSVTLSKEGFEEETFSYQWQIPLALEDQESLWKTKTIPTERNVTVVLRTPTRPAFSRTIEIESQSGPARILALDEHGTIKRVIGETPKSFRIGFAPVHCAEGTITDWRLWHEQDADIWSHDPKGTLFLDVGLIGEGYAPEIIRKHPVLRLTESETEDYTASFHLTQPQAPQAEFILQVDSLPSDATVFVLRPDGTLGAKMGQTPFEVEIGIAQQLRKEGDDYIHQDWLIWAVDGLFNSEKLPNGISEVFLNCALYKENYAVESISQSLFQLQPGRPIPVEKTLTIPLLRPEQAAAREYRSPQQQRSASTSPAHAQDRRTFIWQAPETDASRAPATQEATRQERQAETPKWWQRLNPFRSKE